MDSLQKELRFDVNSLIKLREIAAQFFLGAARIWRKRIERYRYQAISCVTFMWRSEGAGNQTTRYVKARWFCAKNGMRAVSQKIPSNGTSIWYANHSQRSFILRKQTGGNVSKRDFIAACVEQSKTARGFNIFMRLFESVVGFFYGFESEKERMAQGGSRKRNQ
ncbi:MAG: hypothetical protein R2911_28335 [Caldilineaceae bacterium]